ncbi:MAG TPA: HDOD domain-containing protein, partial [Phycisphaerales bacterium]|nr:HDOD domain-containing protein [Phycisphaerales bacterium]
MSATAMDKVLKCTTLPSLPGVAMRVLELSRDANVSLASLGDAVQPDPALVTKVLKTVNSSYYGLTSPCPSIHRAMSMLGLNTVKSIVLGFSLVDFTKSLGSGSSSFDMQSYWRRTIYSAAGARAVAKHIRKVEAEEAFVGALVADIGMLASLAALRDEYIRVTQESPEDHDELVAIERQILSFDHAQIGKELGTKWRLPESLVSCIGYHHSEEMAKPVHQDLVRCVVLGRYLAGTLTMQEPKRKMGQFIMNARDWFSIDNDTAKKLMSLTNTNAAELGKLLEVRTGAATNVEAILADAQEQLVMTQVELARANERLTKKTVTDALTQVNNRAYFDEVSKSAFNTCVQANDAFSILFIDGDRFKRVNDTYGHTAGDLVLKELASRLRGVVDTVGTLCRYGGEEFAIILPGFGAKDAADLAEHARSVIEGEPFDLKASDPELPVLPVTISIGVATLDETSPAELRTVEAVLNAADQAVYAAKKSGRNRVCVGVVGGKPVNVDGSEVVMAEEAASKPAAAAKPIVTPPALKAAAPAKDGKLHVLIVDSDPLASKLLAVLFGKRADLTVSTAKNTDEALAVARASATRRTLAIIETQLGRSSGLELCKQLAGTACK